MNYSELIKNVAKATNQTEKATKAILDSAVEEIVEATREGDNVTIHKLGTFKRAIVGARTYKANGISKKDVVVPEHYELRFAVTAPVKRAFEETKIK